MPAEPVAPQSTAGPNGLGLEVGHRVGQRIGVGFLAARSDRLLRRRNTLRVGRRQLLAKSTEPASQYEASESGRLFDAVISGPSASWKCRCGPLEFDIKRVVPQIVNLGPCNVVVGPALSTLAPMKLDGNQSSVREAIDAGLLAGAVTLVWRAGEVRQVNELGHRDVDAGLPMTRDTIFRIASMTKPVTVAAAMALMEEGKLALTDPVAKWLPELADLRVLLNPLRPAGQDRADPPAHHDRGSDDAPQRVGLRVLGAPTAGSGLRARCRCARTRTAG